MGVKGKLDEISKESKNKKYLLIAVGLAIAGIAITFIPLPGGNHSKNNTTVQTVKSTARTETNYEQQIEKRLVAILEKMEGVGQVSVMVTTYSNEEKVLAADTTSNNQQTEEKDQAGGTRNSMTNSSNQKIVMQSGNTPYVVKENKPTIKGVLILAEGADNSNIRSQIIESVANLLDVPVHKVSVLKKQC
ncbi:hypothetical protein [Cellulosilyticum ruminicola]|uniref:hypothetical protein n=1 Tax=Cellulosilyticum ruminicola TaxID=425254 RepID=UPI0006CF7C33|nr:hypothetical protein [Cellulosilyticum ruminicola]